MRSFADNVSIADGAPRAAPGDTGDVQVIESWNDIASGLLACAEAQRVPLRPAATADSLSALEARLGLRLPEELSKLLGWHDGQDQRAAPLFGDMAFMAAQQIALDAAVLGDLAAAGNFDGRRTAPEPGIKAGWWNPRWIPFAVNASGDHLCLDMDPAPGGAPGQVIAFYHDLPDRELLASGLIEWLRGWVGTSHTE